MDNSSQKTFPILGTAGVPIDLTAAYADNGAKFSGNKKNQLILYVYYTMGAGETANSIQVEVSYSPDEKAVSSALWSQQGAESATGSTITLTKTEWSFAATTAAETIEGLPPIAVPLCNNFVRVRVKETGKASNFGKFYIIGEFKGR